jgi:hypothetical protein
MLDDGQIKFLRELSNWSGVASTQDLGPQTSQDENRARQKCKRQGLVEYLDGYWRITSKGRALWREYMP